jgi:hypothetical protein
MPVRPAYNFANPVGSLVERRDDQGLITQAQPGKSISDTLLDKHVSFYQQRPRVNHDLPREVGPYPRDKRPRTKLSEGVVASIRSHDVMARLSPAIIANDHSRLEMASKVIGQQAFPGVSKAKVDNDVRLQEKNPPPDRVMD